MSAEPVHRNPSVWHGGIAALVVTVHGGAVGWFLTVHPHTQVPSSALPALEATILTADYAAYREPIPELELTAISIDSTAVQVVQFEAPEWGDISNVSAASSSPQLSRFQPVSAAVYARRAGLAPGESVTVLLVLEVLPDGRVGAVAVTRGTGEPRVDQLVIEYAQALRFTPGTQDRHAQRMRISLPITLANV